MPITLDMPAKVVLESPTDKVLGNFYVPALDGLRAIAFLLVFVAHSGLDNIVPGGLGVTLFFFLSGYLITTLLRIEAESSGSISLAKFYLRRCRRIFPPMYITMVLAFALGALGLIEGRGTLRGAVSALLYYFNYLDLSGAKHLLPTGIGVVWSLMIEEHFYFIFPFIYATFTRKGLDRKKQAYILIAACTLPLLWRFVLVFLFHTPLTTLPRWTYSATDARFDSILWGCVLAILCNPWFKDPSGILQRYKGLLASIGLATIFLTLGIRNPAFRETVRYTLQSLALFPIFFYCLSTHDRWTLWLRWWPLKEIGRLSYAMYLIHLLILLSIPRLLHCGYIITIIASFSLTIGYALLMRRLVENPLRRMIA